MEVGRSSFCGIVCEWMWMDVDGEAHTAWRCDMCLFWPEEVSVLRTAGTQEISDIKYMYVVVCSI